LGQPQDFCAEVFCIGTELLTGLTQDTTSYYLAKELALLGCTLRRITVVPDDPADMQHALRGALERQTPVVLTSGGLGPTPDDMTVDVVAAMFGQKPVLHEGILQELMQRRGVTDRSQVRPAWLSMCRVPDGASAYPNPAGTAPCIHLQQLQTSMFLLPGPPREVQAIFEAHVRPFIRAASPFRVASKRVVINMLEAEAGPILAELIRSHPGAYLKGALTQAVRMGDTQHLPVDVVCRAESAGAAEASLAETLRHFAALLDAKGSGFVR